MDKHVFQTSLRWQGQRRGIMSSPDLPDIAVATPPEFPSGHQGIWSPEHLYTAAAEACLMTTFLAIAENSRLEFKEFASRAEGVLEKTESGFLMTEIVLRPRVVVGSAEVVDRARRIVEKAEKACLISNSMKTRIRLEPEIAVG